MPPVVVFNLFYKKFAGTLLVYRNVFRERVLYVVR